ncbi:MAG: hypothetical protein HYV07_20590 [Deltaproteobacteria bacterium]|nr:hypothetical protein [Deltaproteobacteria bacterium]
MRRAYPIAAVMLAAWPARAEPASTKPHLAIGAIAEKGARVSGHGRLLGESVAWALQASGAYELVAQDAAKDAALKKVFEINSGSTSDREWIEVGQAVGATHLLAGEVRQTPTGCSAFVEVIELVSQKTRVTRPEIYDCSEPGLTDLGPELAFQLSGKKLPPELQKTARRLKPSEIDHGPVRIRVEGDRGSVDGRRIAYEDGRGWKYATHDPPRPNPDAGAAHTVEPKRREDPQDPPGRPTPPLPADQPRERPPPAPRSPPASAAPSVTIPVPVPAIVARELTELLSVWHDLLLWLHGLVPLSFFFLGLLWRGSSESLTGHLMGVPIAASFVSSIFVGGAASYVIWSLGELPFDRSQTLTLLAPPGAFVLSIVLARILVPLGEVWVFTQIRKLLLLTIVGSALVLVLTTKQAPFFPLVGLFVSFFVVLQVGARRRKKESDGAS